MKMTPELAKAQYNMKPGIISERGFLGDDSRPLSDIIENDAEIVKHLNLSNEKISEVLKDFMVRGKKGLGNPVVVDDMWEATTEEFRGKIPCPFEDGITRKTNTVVKNLKTGEILEYSELSVHLIEKHGFFQGKESAFRVDPAKFKKVFMV